MGSTTSHTQKKNEQLLITKENKKSEREINTPAELLCLSSDAVERKNSAFRERKKKKKKKMTKKPYVCG